MKFRTSEKFSRLLGEHFETLYISVAPPLSENQALSLASPIDNKVIRRPRRMRNMRNNWTIGLSDWRVEVDVSGEWRAELARKVEHIFPQRLISE